MIQDTQIVLPFARLRGKTLQADFDGGIVSSAGVCRCCARQRPISVSFVVSSRPSMTDGRKKIVGPDRQQKRKREAIEASVHTAQQRASQKVEARDEQRAKVAESASKGHGTRLEQRQHALGRVEQEQQGRPASPGASGGTRRGPRATQGAGRSRLSHADRL